MLLALRDGPYVAVTALGAVLSLHYVLLEVAVPLWVAEHTNAPRWTVAVLFLVNTAAVVLLQVRVAGTAGDVASSAVVARRGGLLVAASCAVFAAASGPGPGPVVAVAVLVTGALGHVAGELLQAAGSWGLGFGLAPERAQGQYQGLYVTGTAASHAAGPLVVTLLAVQLGTPGWVLLAALFAAAALATPPVARWAAASRGSQEV
ncbi:MAG: MFS transporter, partial [Actinomycetota bacterium]|nr:MFS transporter [Actinomycetota bacterium]